MDRKLITGALALLIIQITLLIADVDIYPGSAESIEDILSQDIGIILIKKQNVKKRSQGSVVWEDSEPADQLKNYDSVLTLENSTAQIQLNNDIKIDLYENTLIVLEPQESNLEDSLRIRFSRGHMRSKSQSKKLQMGSEEWEISAKPGTALSLKSLKDEHLEIEVTAGSVNVQNKIDSSKTKEISTGSRLTLSKTEIENTKQISQILQLSLKNEERLYSHTFPIDYFIRWEGTAQKLRVIDADRKINYHDLQPQQQNQILSLGKGTYYLSLEGDQEISKEIILRVIEAPRIRYTAPLPRERFLFENPILFGWLPLEGATNYEVVLTNESTERMVIDTVKTQVRARADIEGAAQMRVFGKDELGFRMPPHYSQPLFILKDALAPPKLQQPEMRAPASPKKKPDHSASTWNWFELFMARAHAEELPEKINLVNKKRHVILSWYPVPGADFYNIEICAEPDFLNPLVVAKTEKEIYTWNEFSARTYYWRVAGGSNSGRMGLFSETAKLDLTNVDQLTTGEISPGVKLFTPKEVIIKPAATAEVMPTAADKPATPASGLSGPDTKMHGPIRPDKWSVSASVNLHHLDYSLDKDFASALSGFANFSMSARASVLKPSNDRYIFSANYTLAKWTPENEATLPYQSELTTSSYSLSGLYQKAGRDFSYGLHIESQPVLKRIALEELTSEDVFLFGPALAYDTVIADNIDFRSQGALLFGDQLFSVSSENAINYQFGQSNWQPYLGGDFNFKLFFGSDSLSGFYLTSGIHLGLKW